MMSTVNPFVSLEACMEHLGSLVNCRSLAEVQYHRLAAEEAGQRLFQRLVLLLPADYAAYDPGEEQLKEWGVLA